MSSDQGNGSAAGPSDLASRMGGFGLQDKKPTETTSAAAAASQLQVSSYITTSLLVCWS